MRSSALLPILFSILLGACADDSRARPTFTPPFDPDGDETETGSSAPRPDAADPDTDTDPTAPDLPPAVPDDLPDDPPVPATEVCYPGPDLDWSVCLPLVYLDAVPDGYAYPDPSPNMWNYRAPIAYLELETLDPDIRLAPDFRLGEIARAWKGPYAVVQPHAVERLQSLRDELGALEVDSGYRPPAYNAMLGGAAYSRHMYGDAFDLEPLDATPDALEDLCLEFEGHMFEYETHVHCDWRDEPLDERFFGVGQ